MQFVRRCYGLRGIYGRFDSKIRFEIESDGRFDSIRTQKNDSQVPSITSVTIRIRIRILIRIRIRIRIWQDAHTAVVLFLALQVVKERDLIGAQLTRRNDELTLLYEKVKINEMTLHKGELQYNERLEDIRILRLEIRHLRCKISVLEKKTQAMDDLRSAAHSTIELVARTLNNSLAVDTRR